jgi:hypothetical protein
MQYVYLTTLYVMGMYYMIHILLYYMIHILLYYMIHILLYYMIHILLYYMIHKCGGTRLCIRSSLLCEPVSLRVAKATSCDVVSSCNRQDLIHSLDIVIYIYIFLKIIYIMYFLGTETIVL